MKVFKHLLLCLIFFGVTGTAHAFTNFWFNPDGDGFGGAVETQLLNAITGNYITDLDLGGGASSTELDAGDTFEESLQYQIYGYLQEGALLPDFLTNQLSAKSTDASGNDALVNGIVDEYIDGDGVAITAANATAELLAEDNFSIAFGIGSGYLTMRDVSDDIVGIFQIIGGGGDFISGVNPTPTSDVGLTLIATTLDTGWFFTETGIDFATLLGTSGNLVIGVGDGSVNVETVTGNVAENSLALSLTENGTTYRINVVPEPTTFVLFGLGLLFTAGITRRKSA